MSDYFPTPETFERIAAIIPAYNTSGDSTIIISTDGKSTTLSARVPRVILRLARSRAIDLNELKNKVRALTQRTLLPPLPITPRLVLIPVKTRLPRIAGDATYGYINLHTVKEVYRSNNKPYHSLIKIAGQTEIPVLWSAASVNRQLALARLAAAESAGYPSLYGGKTLRESNAVYNPEIHLLAAKLVDIFYDILALKQITLLNQTSLPPSSCPGEAKH
ncbi:MAG TPA: hypothetical protein PKA28_09085 [Methylomusa anaerophila]|uniref:Uncharacterized protein n=1 Tax=Methylomusa anaerophila TaxID=1930071 RepID=A0A348AKS8_9FIRM|nr:hypothetical protein [Methylomusa anaerophila]BBB91676.1 hypothetical protein MAMMFC1_02360 [Methylomusa anaerophila]HML88590.1 hypothetical protein [Methylomusa anaerophila]